MRVIRLLEADPNMSLRIVFWWQLIHGAEDGNNISPLQWGSRPNRSSTDAILMKRLTYNGINICKKEAIIFNNDGKAAFDRMIPSVGAIALRRLGSSENAVSAFLQVLQQMKYRVCTALGLSDQAYSNVQDWVLGTLQGSGASPCLWLAITCVLLGAISKWSSGLTLINPRKTRSQTRSAETYVNDTELLLSMEQTPLKELAREMQGVAQFWEQLLYTTGGALALKNASL